MSGTLHISLTINGAVHECDVEPRVTLLDALREHLSMTGTKRAATKGSAAPAPAMSMVSGSCPA